MGYEILLNKDDDQEVADLVKESVPDGTTVVITNPNGGQTTVTGQGGPRGGSSS